MSEQFWEYFETFVMGAYIGMVVAWVIDALSR